MKRLCSLLLLGYAATAVAQAPPEIHFVPVQPSASENVTVLVEGADCPRFLGRVQRTGNRITLRAELIPGSPTCNNQPWEFTYQLGRLPAGRHVVAVEIDNQPTQEREIVISSPDLDETVLYLQAGLLTSEFSAFLDWSLPGETTTRRAYAVPVSPQAGYFWFSSPDNPEATVKIVDGSTINGRGWLFVSPLTTLPFTVTLNSCTPNTSPPLCKTRRYRYPGGRGRLILDMKLE